MIARLLQTLATLSITSGLAIAQPPSSVDEALRNYQLAIAAADQEQLDATTSLKSKYVAALTRLKGTLDPTSDVEPILALAAEIENLEAEEPITAGTAGPKLLAARATYQSTLEKIQRVADTKSIAATEAAIAALRKLTGSLAAGDDLDGALLAEQERRKLEADEAFLAAKGRIAAAPSQETDNKTLQRGDLNQPIPRNGLFAYFPFDGKLDDTKGDTVLQMEGVKKFTSGLSGRALNLAKPSGGTRPSISFPLPDGGREDFSLSYCIRPDMTAHSSKVIFTAGKEGDFTPFWVNYRQSGDVGADVGYDPPGDGWHNEHAVLPKPVPEWHHVTITVTAEEASYYLDGNLMLTMKPNGQLLDLAGMHGYIGTYRRWSGSGDDRELESSGGPNMLLDELSIYTRELSASEARSLAKNYDLLDDRRLAQSALSRARVQR